MTRKDGLLALLVVVVWGLNFVVIKLGLHNMPPLMLAGLRFMLVAFPALLLFIFVAVRRGLQPLESMASEVSTRTFDNLAPVASSKVPREALPLAEAIDRLLARRPQANGNAS